MTRPTTFEPFSGEVPLGFAGNDKLFVRPSRRSSVSSYSDFATSETTSNLTGSTQTFSTPASSAGSSLRDSLKGFDLNDKVEKPFIKPQGIAQWRDSVSINAPQLGSNPVASTPEVKQPQLSRYACLSRQQGFDQWDFASNKQSNGESSSNCQSGVFRRPSISSTWPNRLRLQTEHQSTRDNRNQARFLTPETTSSPDSVFSKISPTSSASSVSDVTTNSSVPNSINFHLMRNALLASRPHELADVQRRHPRRTTVNPSWTKPALLREHAKRQDLVGRLVESATALVAYVWPTAEKFHGCDIARSSKDLLLRDFIQETLRRSRTSYSTLQLTLWYLALIYPKLPKSRYMMEQSGDNDFFKSILCGRRMFLAALMLASKFLQDRNFTARAWSKITGLPAREITNNEFGFVQSIGWKLHLRGEEFHQWNRIVICCTESRNVNQPMQAMWATVLDSCKQGLGLDIISKNLITQLRLKMPTPLMNLVGNVKGNHAMRLMSNATTCNLAGARCPYGEFPALSKESCEDLDCMITPPASQDSVSQAQPQCVRPEDLTNIKSESSTTSYPPAPFLGGLPTPSTTGSDPSEAGDNSPRRFAAFTSQSQAWIEEQNTANQWIAMLAEAAQVSTDANKASTDIPKPPEAPHLPLIDESEPSTFQRTASNPPAFETNSFESTPETISIPHDDLQQLVSASLAASGCNQSSSEWALSTSDEFDDSSVLEDDTKPCHSVAATSTAQNIINSKTLRVDQTKIGSKRPLCPFTSAPAARLAKVACLR